VKNLTLEGDPPGRRCFPSQNDELHFSRGGLKKGRVHRLRVLLVEKREACKTKKKKEAVPLGGEIQGEKYLERGKKRTRKGKNFSSGGGEKAEEGNSV